MNLKFLYVAMETDSLIYEFTIFMLHNDIFHKVGIARYLKKYVVACYTSGRGEPPEISHGHCTMGCMNNSSGLV